MQGAIPQKKWATFTPCKLGVGAALLSGLIANVYAADYASTGPGAASYTIPAGVTAIQVTIIGAGGGAGGNDVAKGGNGGAGSEVKATIAVKQGDVVQMTVGSSGNQGNRQNNATKPQVAPPGGAGQGAGGAGGFVGSNTNNGYSGSGGAGGGASVLIINGSYVRAGGGGGGGGGSWHYAGLPGSTVALVIATPDCATAANGVQGLTGGSTDDGGGGGGGGGSYLNGAGAGGAYGVDGTDPGGVPTGGNSAGSGVAGQSCYLSAGTNAVSAVSATASSTATGGVMDPNVTTGVMPNGNGKDGSITFDLVKGNPGTGPGTGAGAQAVPVNAPWALAILGLFVALFAGFRRKSTT